LPARRPVPGDVAHCGYVKREPTRFRSNEEARRSGWPYCVVCLDLSGRGGTSSYRGEGPRR
jgi:hypothetical protein